MNRYTAPLVERARKHVEAGWSAYRTAFLIEDEFAVRPALTTIRLWTDPVYAAEFSRKNRLKQRARWQKANPHKPQRISTQRALERIREMRELGVSCKAIGIVAGMWWGEPLSGKEVEAKLKAKSQPKAAKSKPTPKRERRSPSPALVVPAAENPPPRCTSCNARLLAESPSGLCRFCEIEAEEAAA